MEMGNGDIEQKKGFTFRGVQKKVSNAVIFDSAVA
jgi:hypothetical protein